MSKSTGGTRTMTEWHRITRVGCLAVHLMPKYHGKKLENAIARILRDGPTGKHELSAVLLANAEDCGNDPKIRNART